MRACGGSVSKSALKSASGRGSALLLMLQESLFVSLFVDAVTRTLTRVLTLLVCMGYSSPAGITPSLGISRATVSDVTVRVVVFAVVYFAVSLWDSLLAVRSDVPETLNQVRVYITAG